MREHQPISGAPIDAPDPFDPEALERRLVEARRRRALALATRDKTVTPSRSYTIRLPSWCDPRNWTAVPARMMIVVFLGGAILGGVTTLLSPNLAGRLFAAKLPAAPPHLAALGQSPRGLAPATPLESPRLPTATVGISLTKLDPPESPTPAPSPLAGVRIVAHVPSSVTRSERNVLLDALTAAGPDALRDGRATVSIRTNNVRYFHEGDREAAETVARVLEAAGNEVVVRDFTDFSPTPPRGSVELWFAGVAPERRRAPAASAPWTAAAGQVAEASLSTAQSVLNQVFESLPGGYRTPAGRSDRDVSAAFGSEAIGAAIGAVLGQGDQISGTASKSKSGAVTSGASSASGPTKANKPSKSKQSVHERKDRKSKAGHSSKGNGGKSKGGGRSKGGGKGGKKK